MVGRNNSPGKSKHIQVSVDLIISGKVLYYAKKITLEYRIKKVETSGKYGFLRFNPFKIVGLPKI